VVLTADPGQELRAVQGASFFAGFTHRWVAASRSRIPDSAVLEAKVCGVGILSRDGTVLLASEAPATPTIDGWTWLLQEKTYQWWLRQPSRERVQASPSQATDGASARLAP
jgi:hypothetical protein